MTPPPRLKLNWVSGFACIVPRLQHPHTPSPEQKVAVGLWDLKQRSGREVNIPISGVFVSSSFSKRIYL